MDVLFEQRVVQNPALGAEVIWYAINEAFELSGREKGVPLILAFIVLPLTFHKRSARALAGKTKPGALYKAKSEEPQLTYGLQERMQAMSERTWQSLSLGIASGLLLLDSDAGMELIPGKKKAPMNHVTEDVKLLLNAAKRVGQALQELPPAQLAATLNVKF